MDGGSGGAAPVRVVLVGANGHGSWHLANIRRLAAEGLVELAGICDRVPPAGEDAGDLAGVEWSGDLAALLARVPAEVAVIATPIHTHLPLADIALTHGVNVLLEKPTTATLAEYHALCERVRETGLACQIGFQSLGSSAIGAVRELVSSGAIGAVRGIGAAGTWVRTSAYYARADWAGRRRLDGRDVVDGVLTNPLAHAVATALALGGAERALGGEVEVELFHAHEIEADDTSCVRLRTPDGIPVTVAATLCAPYRQEPHVTVYGESGRVRLTYTLDEVRLERPGEPPAVTVHPRTDLLRNLVAHLRDGVPLLVPCEATAGFMTVLEAVRTAPEPRPIPLAAQQVDVAEDGVHRVVHGVVELVEESARRRALFSELGADWAVTSENASGLEVPR
ncbi:Gfo/Idh/MocA family protein [Marinactinospora rubrisoli]|uniref:Gfo/Idh/MocA family protein n=1 Tax=Marinactinospora rubrisoli TaxID=2715399 RepID=A0ABW2KNX6_9ACTN